MKEPSLSLSLLPVSLTERRMGLQFLRMHTLFPEFIEELIIL